MRYKPHWKSRGLHVGSSGLVVDNQGILGHVYSQPCPGARSPGGMQTDKLWRARRLGSEQQHVFESLTAALDFLLERT